MIIEFAYACVLAGTICAVASVLLSAAARLSGGPDWHIDRLEGSARLAAYAGVMPMLLGLVLLIGALWEVAA